VASGLEAHTPRARAYASRSENVVEKLLVCDVGVTYAILTCVSK
jgi:hypothetical protein